MRSPDDLLPLWVADMDFKLPEEILADFHKRIDHGIFGYTDPDQEYYDALDRWFAVRHGYHVEPETVTVGCGVVYGLATGVKAFTKDGDSILIQQPDTAREALWIHRRRIRAHYGRRSTFMVRQRKSIWTCNCTV